MSIYHKMRIKMKHWDGSLLNNGTSNHGATDARASRRDALGSGQERPPKT